MWPFNRVPQPLGNPQPIKTPRLDEMEAKLKALTEAHDELFDFLAPELGFAAQRVYLLSPYYCSMAKDGMVNSSPRRLAKTVTPETQTVTRTPPTVCKKRGKK